MLTQWERFPVKLFKLVAIQRSRPVISAVRAALQGMDRLHVRPPDWVDPFEDRVLAAAKRASFEAHLNKVETAALTAQEKAERTLENVAKARRMLADPTLLSGCWAQLVRHRATGPRDDQLAVGSLQRPNQAGKQEDPTEERDAVPEPPEDVGKHAELCSQRCCQPSRHRANKPRVPTHWRPLW
jgi:hypothetical protein